MHSAVLRIAPNWRFKPRAQVAALAILSTPAPILAWMEDLPNTVMKRAMPSILPGYVPILAGAAVKPVQMNAGLTALANQDWLISPALDLSAYNIPLLRFYSRTRFEGPSLQLKVSTNYTGSGDPALATWTSLAGKFPNENSDVWTLSDSINLSAYKQAGVYLAWVYTSTSLEGPRWSIDDVQIFNAAAAAVPYAKVFNYFKNLGIASTGSPSPWRKIDYEAADITDNLTINAPAGFEVSADGITGSSSVVLTPAQANGAHAFYTRSWRLLPTMQIMPVWSHWKLPVFPAAFLYLEVHKRAPAHSISFAGTWNGLAAHKGPRTMTFSKPMCSRYCKTWAPMYLPSKK